MNLSRSFYKVWYGFIYPFVFNVLGFHWITYFFLGKSMVLRKNDNVLEIGAGYPLHLLFSKFVRSYTAIDKTKTTVSLSNKLLKILKLDHKIKHEHKNLFELQIEQRKFDKICAVNLWTGEPSFKEFINNHPYRPIYNLLENDGVYFEKFIYVPFDNASNVIEEELYKTGFKHVESKLSFGGFSFIYRQIYAFKFLNTYNY